MRVKGRKPLKCKYCGKPMGTFIRSRDPKIKSLNDVQHIDMVETVAVYQCKNPNCEHYRGQNSDALPPLFLHLLGYDTELTRNSDWEDASREIKRLWDKCCEREG